MTDVMVCTPRSLPKEKWIEAADRAVTVNPANHPRIERLVRAMPDIHLDRLRIAVVTAKYWGAAGVKLTVGFLDNPPMDLRKRILLHMNAWAKTANVQFVESKASPHVRIARIDQGDQAGYWSYVGTDILSIPANEPTLNLQGFTMQTPESEFHRVVRHETGHTMGFPHEHMRRELVSKIDRQKAIDYFGATQGWSPAEVEQQVLTPIEEASIRGTAHADPHSIMCYQIPGTLTKDGKPIVGGLDIDKRDFKFAAMVYPRPNKTSGAAKSPRAEKKAGMNAGKKRTSTRPKPLKGK
jgi:Astacin (Peptidase family M12A)